MALGPVDLEQKSAVIADSFLGLVRRTPKLTQASVFALYWGLTTGEVQTQKLAEGLRALGYRVAFPRVCDGFQLSFHEVLEFPESSSWEKNRWGVWEPLARGKPVIPSELSCVVVPGCVFDQAGTRVGRGAGYYDRFLVSAPQALRVGLCFEVQVAPSLIPKNDWDIPVQAWVSEARVQIVDALK